MARLQGRTAIVTGDFVRANVSGRKSTVPFTGTLSCGSTAAGGGGAGGLTDVEDEGVSIGGGDRKSTRLNSSHT